MNNSSDKALRIFQRGSAIDDFGNIFETGAFKGKVTFGKFQLKAHNRTQDIFAVKYNKTNGEISWAKSAGSAGSDIVVYHEGNGIVVNRAGDVYVFH